MPQRPQRIPWSSIRFVGSALLLAGWGQLSSAQPDSHSSFASTAALQAALDRNGFGVGLIDGRPGTRTQTALTDYFTASGTTNTGEAASFPPGVDIESAFRSYVVTTQDWEEVGTAPLDWVEASKVPHMACESLLELLSEKFHASENILTVLNKEISSWDTNVIGKTIKVPNVSRPRRLAEAAYISIDCSQFRLRVYDTNKLLVASFPCSIARDRSKAPTGDLHITTFAENPVYVFDPKNFPESPQAQSVGRKLIIPSGPNNPVGGYWIGINKPGFGIHGTPHPETIGRQESHGCFRLTNWDIIRLSKILHPGIPVEVTGL